MTRPTNQKWVLARRPEGEPTDDCFRLEEEEVGDEYEDFQEDPGEAEFGTFLQYAFQSFRRAKGRGKKGGRKGGRRRPRST